MEFEALQRVSAPGHGLLADNAAFSGKLAGGFDICYFSPINLYVVCLCNGNCDWAGERLCVGRNRFAGDIICVYQLY